ncbi:glycoside hydrolase family 127 protein [Dysgonomonas sp. Marseille-P4677]|uniref:glycoside hydrolase family 127 protein n=1 Tax=Dysgonomonas sp. Marseille-P4677 TaxID=2364790 RepID=UPI001912FE6A|nr:glycoside hydrolase family 127 protein [Dysgonomonas sp. Marseille-P4677]MBK5720116.1 glycoside hydrolase family 127 protein [Dysgonomonas sp. Marseille-P4677]
MKEKLALFIVTAALMLSCKLTEEPSQVQLGEIKEVPFTDVHFTDEFWLPRMEINRTVSIPSAFHQCEINGRFDNFALAGGLIKGEHKGDFSFDDTDPYKIIEGASYSLAVKYDPKLDAYLDSVITLIAAAQEPDGYLTTCVTNKCTRLSGWWGSARWEKINSHELYNSGHLYEAAVAHYQATKKRSLLDVAIKNADLVCQVFGPNEGQKHVPSGHPIIEMALVKLYNVTNDKKYLDMARYFVDETGRGTDGHKLSPYSQDHKPILEQDEIVGHAVRAGYLYSGVTDVASMLHDKELFNAVDRVWDNMASKKLYIIGGIGSRAQGEGFGPNYELNNFNNYCETCASIANVYWNQRMFLATGESKYVDVLERALYNGLIAGVSLSGDRFFYGNPMASDGGFERAPWFGCACCPGNVTRFMASVPGYVYAVNKKDIYVNLFVEGNSKIKLDNSEIELAQKTKYPWEGDVEIEVNPSVKDKFTILLRIPGWAKNKPVPSDLYHYVDGANPDVKISVNGQDAKKAIRGGYAVIEREWKSGDKIAIHMDMPIRRVQAHKEVKYDEGLLSIERGPIVYALESIDQKNNYLFDIVIPRDSKIDSHFEKNLLNGVMVLEGNASIIEKDSTNGKLIEQPFTFKAIPYSTWNNRGQGQLVVWTAETSEYAIVKPEPTIASQAWQVDGWGFKDQFEPKSSADINTPYHYWWLKAGTEESIGYKFKKPKTVSNVEVYWLAFEHYDVIYKAPESWKLLYKDGNSWKEVKNTSPYGTELDKYNKVTFEPVTTTELKMVVQLQRPKAKDSSDENGPQVVDVGRKGYSGGVIEWKVNR